jgi:proliferating cell nuclear antigen
MLEATVAQGNLWKKLIDCINGLVNEANFDCSPGGMSIQAMDTSHVALVHLLLRDDGFSNYQCERNCILGLNLASLSKVLKIVEGGDTLTFRHESDSDAVTLTTESKDRAKKCEFQLKLLEIEAESMGIPDLEYKSHVTLSSQEFARIARDMAVFGDTVTVEVDNGGVKFSSAGDVGEGYAYLRAAGASDVKKSTAVKTERVKVEKAEPEDDDAPLASKFQVKQEKGGDAAAVGVEVNIEEPVSLSFALRFMNIFARGAALSDRVTLNFTRDSPCMIEFDIEGVGYLRYYLAPKVDDAEQ